MPHRTSSCFLHIPKTGGSLVIAALQASLPRNDFHHTMVAPGAPVPLRSLLHRYAVVAGHFALGQFTHDLLDDTFVFTFLREPVDRALSLYYFYREQLPDALNDARVALVQSVELAPFVEQLADRVSPWCNWQTFICSGAIDCERPARELLPMALDNLNRLSFVGVQDELLTGLECLADLRGWTLTLPRERVNRTASRPDLSSIPASIIRRLAELNECDTELFARARTKWSEARARGGVPLNPRAVRSPLVRPSQRETGNRQIVITDVSVEVKRGLITVRGRSEISTNDVTVGIRITNAMGLEIYGINSRLLGKDISVAAGDEIVVTFEIATVLGPGEYCLTAAIHGGLDHLDKCYHWIDDAVSFTAEPSRRFSGLVDLQATADVQISPAP